MQSRSQPERSGISKRERAESRVREAAARLAKTSGLTVLTESVSHVHTRGTLRQAVHAAAERRAGGGYSLISLPRLKYAFASRTFEAQLIADIVASAAGGRLLVAPAYGCARSFVRRLRRRPEIIDARISVEGTDSLFRPRPADDRTLVITCDDHRLHGRVSFADVAGEVLLGTQPFELMTVPGSAKGLRANTTRGDMALSQLEAPIRRGLRRIVLLAHTDCAAYGGSSSFGGDTAEIAALHDDLEITSRFFGRAFPKVRVDAAVIRLRGGVCCGIRR